MTDIGTGDHARAAVKVVGLHKRFGATEVLKGISFAAQDHEVLAILGSSGSGKSTLLRCLNLLEVPDAGEVWIEGALIRMRTRHGVPEPADRRQVERIRRRVAMVFQQFNLWAHMTALENVIEAPVHVLGMARKEAIERAEAMLGKVGLGAKRDAYPAALSGGQQQRVAIARALAMEPDLMLFDEPTSALDPELVGDVLKVIRDLAEEGRTMLLVTHEMGFARDVASRVLFLNEGTICEEGPPIELFGNPQTEALKRFLANARSG